MRTAFKYIGGLPRDLKTLKNGELFIPVKSYLNDPFEGFINKSLNTQLKHRSGSKTTSLQSIFNEVVPMISSIGIYSLSKNVTNELLWAHYGNQHYGYAVEYDLEVIHDALNFNSQEFIQEFDIKYKNTPVSVDILKKDPATIVNKVLGTKSKVWKYEEEVRLIFQTSGLLKVPYCAVKGIYFGLRMQETKKRQVMKALSGRGINYFNLNSKASKYLLEVKPVDDIYLKDAKFHAPPVEVGDYLLSSWNLNEHFAVRPMIDSALDELKFLPYLKKVVMIKVTTLNDVMVLTVGAEYAKPFGNRIFEFQKATNGSKFIRM